MAATQSRHFALGSKFRRRSKEEFAWRNNYCTKSVKPVAELVEPLLALTTTL